MADRVESLERCPTALADVDAYGEQIVGHTGHFWRPSEPFSFAWCDGGEEVEDPLPCAIRQGGTWASACVIPPNVDHDEHRSDTRARQGRYDYWFLFPGGFVNYSARKHDGWDVGAPRDPSEDDPNHRAVKEAEAERQARMARRGESLDRAIRLRNLIGVGADVADNGGIRLGPEETDDLLDRLAQEVRP